MIINFSDDLDLFKIAESGQCFRWIRVKDENPAAYRIIAGGRVLFLDFDGGTLDLSCDEGSYEAFWRDYLDFKTNYKGIRELIKREKDEYLFNAAESGKGIRILKQDPFETLISFIISQRKNIPAIRASIEKLCALAGKKIELSEGEREWLDRKEIGMEAAEGLYSFPGPKEIACLSQDELKSCGTGYRAPYLSAAAKQVSKGILDLSALERLNDEELLNELMKLYGVGVKVASCACLFGFHRLDFFPVDVWIGRVLSEHYENGFPFSDYAPYNGVMQQYLFFGARS